jgi:bla regulator protein BlaR1
MSVIDPNKIEAINVLKGPSATSLYGDKGKDGVIMITTKTGNAGKDDRGPIVVRGYKMDPANPKADDHFEIVTDSVITNGKTVFIKSGKLADATMISKNFDGSGNPIIIQTEGKKVVSSLNVNPALIFIDGEKKTKKEMEEISPDQIKSIDIIKGDAAIKAYGAEAKDGVIKITTKKKVNL